jgi:hypothetical protein
MTDASVFANLSSGSGSSICQCRLQALRLYGIMSKQQPAEICYHSLRGGGQSVVVVVRGKSPFGNLFISH